MQNREQETGSRRNLQKTTKENQHPKNLKRHRLLPKLKQKKKN
jgi:hypothetical protein